VVKSATLRRGETSVKNAPDVRRTPPQCGRCGVRVVGIHASDLDPAVVTRLRAVIAADIRVRVSDGVIHLVVTGDIDHAAAETLRAEFGAVIGADRLRRLVIDLRDATLCGRAGPAAVRACRIEAARRGVECAVVDPAGPVSAG
jgi:anti-anti-sigma regulatory factor